MRELNTIQKVEKLNRVFATDEIGNGGANHEYMIEGVISEGHGRALLGITNSKEQYELAQTVIDEKLSVRELELLIRKIKKTPTKGKQKSSSEVNPYYKDITYKLENYFGTKVNITNKNKYPNSIGSQFKPELISVIIRANEVSKE